MLEELNDYKDKYQKERTKCIEIESKLSEVNKETLKLEKEITQLKNELTFICEKQPTADNLKLKEKLNTGDKLTDTFNKQHNLQLKVEVPEKEKLEKTHRKHMGRTSKASKAKSTVLQGKLVR